jgi:hypothetical protein
MRVKSAANLAAALQGLGGANGILGHPVVKMALRYWWVSVPVGIGFYGKYKQIQSEHGKKAKIYHYINGAADVVGPVLTLVSVAELATRMQEEGKLDRAAQQARDVEFTTVEAPQGSMDPPPPYLQRAPQGSSS